MGQFNTSLQADIPAKIEDDELTGNNCPQEKKYSNGTVRPEWQNGLLCPLHCCVACNGDLMRQSAYERPLTECTECLCASHTETCLPMGEELITVRMEIGGRMETIGGRMETIGGRMETIEMLDGPSHAEMDRPTEQMKCRCGCNKETGKGLVNCETCLRSFHKGCRTVKKVSGRVAEEKACDHCLLQKTLRSDVPVIGLNQRKPVLGYTRAWTDCPRELKSNEEFGKIGMAAVELVLEKKFVIAPVNELTKLTVKRSRKLLKTKVKLVEDCEGLCERNNRCTTNACVYWRNNCECPPECNKDGRVCHNRKATEGKVNRLR